ncbi:MAG: lactate utilization protein [Dehalococcoidales bacterium]|nr:MAG: lactate utilization protein [Dehalococcoidales bacterium]
MADIEELVEQFKADATRTGAVVYEAEGAGDARDYVLKLAQERGVRHIVKSKSAVAEGIGLREHLEKAGIEVRETDIGQWIAQLAGEEAGSETDKTVEQVAELISRETGQKLEPEGDVLMAAARRFLRQSYINAGMGISGADFGIAETGTMVNLSNDGNDRLATVLPLIHVTMMKREDIVATLSDAISRIKTLVEESGGGQIPSYITYHTGRNTTGDIRGALMARAQGPEEEHIVLLGNA